MSRKLAMAALFLSVLGVAHADDKSPVLSQVVEDAKGEKFDLKSLKGKVVLVVNVASQCGFTNQYKGLQKLYDTYKDKGLVVLAFPCNQFGGQEPGSNEEILGFCKAEYGVSFPVMGKVSVKGPKQCETFGALLKACKDSSEVKWNFEKFLVGRDGQVIERYRSRTTPDDLVKAVEAALAAKAG